MAGLGVDHLVHEMSARDAVETSGEQGAGHVLLLDILGDGRVHGLVVWSRRDVDGVVCEVDASEFAVEVISRVVDVASGGSSSSECDAGRLLMLLVPSGCLGGVGVC